MRLDDGWNQIQFNLSDFTRRAYGEQYRVAYTVTACVVNTTIPGVHVLLTAHDQPQCGVPA
jgi:hypothetical protein